MSDDNPPDSECARSDQTFRRTFDFQTIPPSRAAIQTVAAVSGIQTTDLPPLYEDVDPESLDTLVLGDRDGSAGLCIEFEFHEYRISVYSSGILELTHLDELEDE